ncbi:MAG: hypothetical protein NC548_15880 [Lachnospiraceae bacterium]|nr:hypothetical protein [Lachnospiraceae bacterium]
MARRRYKKPKNEWPKGNELPKSSKMWADQIPPNGYKDFNKRLALSRHLGIYMVDGTISPVIMPESVYEESMPDQIKDVLGVEFNLRYKLDKTPFDNKPESVGWIPDDANNDFYTYIDKFRVIRWDSNGNVVILVNDEKHLVIVSKDIHVQCDYKFHNGTAAKDEYDKVAHNDYIHKIPVQDYRFLGANVMCSFIDSNGTYHLGTIIRADAGGTDRKCIILEDRGDSYRVVCIEEGYFFIQHADIELNSTTTETSIYEQFWPKDWRNLK